MSLATHKRSVMTLYSSFNDPYSHRVRIVLAEKGVTVDILEITSSLKLQEEVQELNPYNTVPTLVDRDLVLYRSEVIMEYLDERFPHPPLLPIYPIAKARSRLMIYRINYDWYRNLDIIMAPTTSAAAKEQAQKELCDSINSITPIFKQMPYFISEEFSLIDCCAAPLLWLLPKLGINLLEQNSTIKEYAQRLFERESFKLSITPSEGNRLL